MPTRNNAYNDLRVALFLWRSRRTELNGMQKKHFYRWVMATKPELVQCFEDPVAFQAQCNDLQRAGRLPRQGSIGEETLNRHADALVRKYMARCQQVPTLAFDAFVQQLVDRCKSEKDLKKLLDT